MNIHIALYDWKVSAKPEDIATALATIETLADKIPGILDIVTGENTSKYGEGYTHVILVRGENQAAIEAYRAHPDHARVAKIIEDMEERGIGIDLQSK